MPKGLRNYFASKEKADSTDARTEALTLLQVELFRMLISKNILSSEEVDEIFSNAVEQASSSREEEMLQRIYEFFTEPPDSGEEADVDEGEEDDSVNE